MRCWHHRGVVGAVVAAVVVAVVGAVVVVAVVVAVVDVDAVVAFILFTKPLTYL